MNKETKQCQNCKKDFVIESEDFSFYEKIKVPPPTFCPDCRTQRRFIFRNERGLYKRKSDFSGELIFSMFSPDAAIKIYENDIWYSDKWSPMEHGREVDFSQPFINQFAELFKEIPLPARSVIRLVNSDYSNNASDLKNCYLVFNSNYVEDSCYGNSIDYCKDCFDNSHIAKCELSYENIFLTHCSKSFFSAQCEDSANVYFSKNLRGCNDCFGCINLRNKNYYIFNKPYTREDYVEKIKGFNLGSYGALEQMKTRVRDFWLQFPNKFMEGVRNTNVSGNYIYNSKNVLNSFLIREGEDLKYCQYLQVPPNKACYDYSIWGRNNSSVYECVVCGHDTNNIKFCAESFINLKNMEYCYHCESCSDCFGCISLRKKQYCILNKQYTKEEYEELIPKIIKHMDDMPYKDKQGRIYKYGEFFPPELSPFCYNETIAQEYFPLTKDEAIKQGYSWKDPEQRNYQITIKAEDLPDNIKDVKDSITNEIIGCEHQGKCNEQCTTAFKIIPQELQFYKRMNLPLPRLCPNCRHYQRLKQRNPLKLWKRKCMNTPCPNEFQTSYSPERKEIVYCEQCYNSEVA